jgi:hypothetical protein
LDCFLVSPRTLSGGGESRAVEPRTWLIDEHQSFLVGVRLEDRVKDVSDGLLRLERRVDFSLHLRSESGEESVGQQRTLKSAGRPNSTYPRKTEDDANVFA